MRSTSKMKPLLCPVKEGFLTKYSRFEQKRMNTIERHLTWHNACFLATWQRRTGTRNVRRRWSDFRRTLYARRKNSGRKKRHPIWPKWLMFLLSSRLFINCKFSWTFIYIFYSFHFMISCNLSFLKSREDAYKLMKYVYTKHPPKCKFTYDEKLVTTSTAKKHLMTAITHYHPDKQVWLT